MNNLFFRIIVVVFLVVSASGCKCFYPSKYSNRNKYYMVYEYRGFVEDEAFGKPAFPKGKTWEQYWTKVFQVLRDEASVKGNFDDVIEQVKKYRKEKGLPPVE